ncbi:MAG: helix-turn-helix transcriptional regulator [Ruminococcaceae bacterium]|nr:helix-turn-helix transcriptional regulator [Oscillospiraceae bacterium]
MKDVKSIVAKNLTMLRKNKGLTQVELAEKLNYSDKAVSRWEHGETLPDINMLYELCDFYGITMNDLVDENCQVEEIDAQAENNARKYRIWLGILTASVVWLFATVLFVYSQLAAKGGYWIVFIWAIPVSFLFLQYLCRNVFNWIVKFVLTSISIWTVITGMYLHMLVTYQVNLWMVYIVGVPVQALVFLWQKMRKYKV